MSDDYPTVCAVCGHAWHGSWQCKAMVRLDDGSHRQCACAMSGSSVKPRQREPRYVFGCRNPTPVKL